MISCTRLLALCAAVTCVLAYGEDDYGTYYDYGENDQPSHRGGASVSNYDYLDYDYNYGQDYGRQVRAGPSYRANRGDQSRYRHRYQSNPNMLQYAKSYQPKPMKEFVPVVIKKKQQKKKKILTSHHGFYIPGGTAMFGKFKDLHSCEKACEITPTCFAGDFNPWLGKCFFHSNLTACASMRSHKAITHFKKVPCAILESARGHVTLGASVTHGIEIKGIDTLQDCIKKCATAGQGVASATDVVNVGPQLCCNLDYDFSTHKCFFHLCISELITRAEYCAALVIDSPLNSIVNPSAITITICPILDVTG